MTKSNIFAGVAAPLQLNDPASVGDYLKLLRMVAACWGCNYPAAREFDTTWKRCEVTGMMQLVDAAENGICSIQVEGLYVRYLLQYFGTPRLPPAALGLEESPEGAVVIITRDSWSAEAINQQDWELLRSGLQVVANSHNGFFSEDMDFADLAIDHLKGGGAVEGSVCSRRRSPAFESEN